MLHGHNDSRVTVTRKFPIYYKAKVVINDHGAFKRFTTGSHGLITEHCIIAETLFITSSPQFMHILSQ